MARILVVEDSPTKMYKITSLLEKNGHVVLTAQTGEEGVKTAKQELPDVVLIASLIVSSGLNGPQAIKQIAESEETNNIPVIFIADSQRETNRVWVMSQGAIAYLTKPIDEHELISTVSEAIG